LEFEGKSATADIKFTKAATIDECATTKVLEPNI